MTILIVLVLLVAVVFASLGFFRAFGAKELAGELETAFNKGGTDLKEAVTMWWMENVLPFFVRMMRTMVVVNAAVLVMTVVMAYHHMVPWYLPGIVGVVTVCSAIWVHIQTHKTAEDFSSATAFNGMVAIVATMGAGVYVYGQFANDVVTSLLGYTVILAASEAVCATVLMAAWVLARANQVLEGSANIGVQVVRDVLLSGNAALQKIVDLNFADEETFVPRAEAWCGRVRFVRDATLLLGILLPSPVTLVLGTIAALVTSVGVRTYERAKMGDEASKKQKAAAKSYNFILAVLLPLVALRFLPYLLAAFPKEWSEQFSGIGSVVAALKEVLAFPTAYIATAIVAASIYLPKRNVESKPRSGALTALTVLASFVLFIAYWVMWGKTVFYVLPMALAAFWLVSRASIRGAGICLGGGYLIVLLGMALIRNNHVSKEQAVFGTFAGKAMDTATTVVAAAVPTATASAPVPTTVRAPVGPSTTDQAQASTPAPAPARKQDMGDDMSVGEAWAVLCKSDPEACNH